MNNPKVSVITVCYNAASTISETIKSVLSQSYTNLEYIIVDGASADNTAEIVASFRDERIRFISEKDEGLYDAINKGLYLSKGDILAILHADDRFYDSNVLSFVADQLSVENGPDALAGSVNIFKPGDLIKPYRVYNAAKFRDWQFRIGIQPPHPGFFITRNAFEKVGYYRTQYKISGDFEWLLRAIRIHKLKVKYTDKVCVNMLDGGLSSSGWKSKTLLNKEILRILKMHGIYSNKLLVYSKYLLKVFQLRFI